MQSLLKKYSAVFISLLVFGILGLCYAFIPSFKSVTQELWSALLAGNTKEVQKIISGFGFWGALILVLIIVLQMFLIVVPSWLPMVVAALAYGFIEAVAISVSGVFIASSLGYVLGLQIGHHNIKRISGKKNYKKLSFWVKEYGFLSVLLFRISPFLSNDAISFIAGGMKMNFLKFIGATLAGIIPLSVAIAYFSSSINQLKESLYYIGGAGILLYGIFIWLDYRKRKSKA